MTWIVNTLGWTGIVLCVAGVASLVVVAVGLWIDR